MRRRIELDLPEVLLGILDAIAGLSALGLAGDDRPVLDVRPGAAIGATHQCLARQPLPADAVGEPARVGHLVERVDVERRSIDALAGRHERVLDEVVDVAGRDLLRLRRVEGAVVVDPDRIVRIEARSVGGLEPGGEGQGAAVRGNRERGGQGKLEEYGGGQW